MNVQLTRMLLTLSLAGFALLSSVANAGSILWGTSSSGTNPSSVFTIDTTTGTATLLGSTTLGNKISAIAVDPEDGTLYAIRGSACTGARLVTIDPSTGIGTIVGILIGSGFDGTNDTGTGSSGAGPCHGGSDALVFGSDGTLYAGGWNGGTDGGKLLVVDKATGEVTANFATDINPADGLPSHIAGMATASNGDIWVSRGNNAAGTLHTINTSTGSFSSPLTLSNPTIILSDIAFAEDGTLYASDPQTGQLVSVNTGDGTISVIGAFGGGEKISGLTSLVVEVLAEACKSGAGGCNPTGAQTIELPPNAVFTATSTITQTSFRFSDMCTGSARTFMIPGQAGSEPLKIPGYLCGSPDFVVLVTEVSDVTFPNGTVLIENEPGVFFTNPLPCNSPLNGADPQLQDVVVWQPTDFTDVLEMHAIELTDDCGSSRGRTRKLSYLVIGMHIDFNTTVPADVRNGFLELTKDKVEFLKQAVQDSKSVLKRGDFKKLQQMSKVALKNLEKGNYDDALDQMENFVKFAERANYGPSSFNHNGEHIARGSNIKFMIADRIIPLFASP